MGNIFRGVSTSEVNSDEYKMIRDMIQSLRRIVSESILQRFCEESIDTRDLVVGYTGKGVLSDWPTTLNPLHSSSSNSLSDFYDVSSPLERPYFDSCSSLYSTDKRSFNLERL